MLAAYDKYARHTQKHFKIIEALTLWTTHASNFYKATSCVDTKVFRMSVQVYFVRHNNW